jgi:hypothetical protein
MVRRRRLKEWNALADAYMTPFRERSEYEFRLLGVSKTHGADGRQLRPGRLDPSVRREWPRC